MAGCSVRHFLHPAVQKTSFGLVAREYEMGVSHYMNQYVGKSEPIFINMLCFEMVSVI